MNEGNPSSQAEKYQTVVDLLTKFNSTGELSKLNPNSSDDELQIVLEGEARQIRSALEMAEMIQDTEKVEELQTKLKELEQLRDEIAGTD